MANTITITGLKTPFTYLVDSVTNNEKSEYVVNTHKKTCSCPYGTHKPEAVIAKPCKHLQLCLSSEFESITKNYVHFQLFKKGLVVAKVTKLTPIFKAGKKTKIVAASYILNDGSRRCCFVIIGNIGQERFFEVYESTKDINGNRVFKVGVTGDLVQSIGFNFGSQFDLVFKDGFYTKKTYGDIGCYTGYPSTSIYDAMTSFLLPELESRVDGYLEYLANVIAKKSTQNEWYNYYQHNAIQLAAMGDKTKKSLLPIPLVSKTFNDKKEVVEFKTLQAA